MAQFDDDIRLARQAGGHYLADISDTWNVNVGPNGGYIAALILNGMKLDLGDEPLHTRSVTFHFLSAAKPGAANLEVTKEKLGRTLSTLTARLMQGNRTIAMAIATFANARNFFGFSDLVAPQVPAPEAIAPSRRMNVEMSGHVPFRDHYDQRLAIGPVPPDSSDQGHVGGWTRFADRRAFDDLAVVAISDSWYPSIMAKSLPTPMHAPTVDHSVHFMQTLPLEDAGPDDFLLVEFSTSIANDGYLIEDGRIWSQSGHLIATSRQLAIMMGR